MALEPTGIDLQIKNFTEYIKRLGKINKTQQEVFDTDSKKLDDSFKKATDSAKKYQEGVGRARDELGRFVKTNKGAGAAIAAGGIGVGIGAALQLTDAIIGLGQAAASTFFEITKGGIALNQQFELSEKVFSNVFGDPTLGAATVDFLNETADRLRVARGEAASFAQTILPRTGGLDEFTELLRLTDIQADTTGQSISELEFSIREALSGDFVSLKDRFDLGTEQINRIKELTPELGRSQALVTVLTEEFTRLGKTDISGTLGTNIKDLQSTFTNLQIQLGEPTFEQLRIQSESLLGALDRNQEGLSRTAIALGEVTANVVELIGTEIVSFIDNLDFQAIEQGIGNLNAFIEALRILKVAIQEAFSTGVIQTAFGVLTGNVRQTLTGFQKLQDANFGESFQRISDATENAIERQQDYNKRVEEAANAESDFTASTEAQINAFLQQQAETDQSTQAIENYNAALKQAESLQLSFTRAAEDSARRLNRQTAKLARNQFRDRVDLLNDQAKEFDKFQEDELEDVQDAEQKLNEAREKAGKERLRDQDKLHRELRQAEERFNLDRLQSQRRFGLQDRRLRAAGDILALQELREDFALQQQEAQENFGLQDKQRKEDAKSQSEVADEQRQEQIKQLEQEVNDLRGGLDRRRTEFLASQTEEFNALLFSQAQQRQALQESYREQQEDARISQQRQLEDLGRSFANQEGVTIEGTTAIANQLEKIFGIDGAADTIISGFTTKTESEFTDLFKNIEETVKAAEAGIEGLTRSERTANALRRGLGTGGGFGERIGGLQEFNDGGVVGGPGPIGSPVPVMAHVGETFLPTHQQSFSMSAPAIPSQTLDVNMSGGFNITGGEAAGEVATRQAITEMTDAFEVVVKRLGRQI